MYVLQVEGALITGGIMIAYWVRASVSYRARQLG